MIKQEKYTAKRQFELIAGDKVLFAHDLDFVTLEYLGMTGANGSWMFAKEEIKTNFYGLFHWNNSQKYYFYEPEDDL